MTSNDLLDQVGPRIREKANLIWNVANSLAGPFKPHEYGLVILPMAVVKRFHDCLLPTRERVLAEYEKVKDLEIRDGFLRRASGQPFWNTSRFTFDTLVSDPANIESNFADYLSRFSPNVRDILARMDFDAQIRRMVEAGVLYQVVSDFRSEAGDMSPERVSAVDMGYIFENLIQRFSESYDEQAGAHFTSRDIIYLMCDLLVAGDRQAFGAADGLRKTVYDMTMGTSQMLACMQERLRALDSRADVDCFGQEINPFTFGIAKADMLIRGGNPDNMQFGDTLSDDRFAGYRFDYVISNPPFGIDWKREATAVEAEHRLGDAGRFGPGLPSKSDGQMLFLLNGLAKLKEESGRMAIIQNGSSLFAGDAGSGPSEIRRRLIESDWLDAIVQLPSDSFYNTGIATYVWLVAKNRPESHRGKVLLVDASRCFEPRRKPIGHKRVDITGPSRDLVVRVCGAYRSGDFTATAPDGTPLVCKARLLDSVELGYNKIVIETPVMLPAAASEGSLGGRPSPAAASEGNTPGGRPSPAAAHAPRKRRGRPPAATTRGDARPPLPGETAFLPHASDWLPEGTMMVAESMEGGYGTPPDEKPTPLLKRGKPVPDPDKRDTENVPLAQDIDAYLEREVRPWNPHAYIDYSKTKVGYEIPFTRTFYEYTPLEPADAIAARIQAHEKALAEKLAALFGDGMPS
jgi:type I restriction enzyme M protein